MTLALDASAEGAGGPGWEGQFSSGGIPEVIYNFFCIGLAMGKDSLTSQVLRGRAPRAETHKVEI